jgi:hypothetical protein
VSAQAKMLHECFLGVKVNVFADGRFAIDISIQRQVFYLSGGKWLTIRGITWGDGGVGIAHDADYILGGIAQDVEVFCNEFLKANGK